MFRSPACVHLASVNHILQDIIRDEKASEQKQELKKVLEEQKLGAEPELVRVAGKLTYVVGGDCAPS